MMTRASGNSTPLVSVTSAFRNEGLRLVDMIKSILAQTFEEWELVLLDDGSTDNSLELARSIDDPRIRVFSNDRNLGRGASLNKLTALARGQYIARMDADDMSATTRLERQVSYLNDHADVDLVGTGIMYISTQGEPLGSRDVLLDHASICRDPQRGIDICHGSILARRQWLERFEYDESLPLAVDQNLFYRAHAGSTFANISEPLYYYCYEPSFTLKKQWTSRRISASYLFKHHRASGHLGRAFYHWCVQHAKLAVVILSFAVGLRRKLLARRFQPLSSEQRSACAADLAKIRATDVSESPKIK